MPATLNSSGVEAVRRIVALLETARPFHHGSEIIESGTMLSGGRFFICVVGGEAVFAVGLDLFTQPYNDFFRDSDLIAMGEGARRAEWLVPIGQGVMLFATSFFSAAFGLIGVASSLTVSLAKIYTFYSSHQSEIERATPYILILLRCLNYFRINCPMLFSFISREAAWQTILSAREGVTIQDAAVFLGKFLGSASVASVGANSLRISIGRLVFVASKVSFFVAASRTLPNAAQGAPVRARLLIEELSRNGIQVSEAEVAGLINGSCLNINENRNKIEELIRASTNLQPILNLLDQAFRVEVMH